jgi:ATP-binding cassette, subfamily B, bacterial PglK
MKSDVDFPPPPASGTPDRRIGLRAGIRETYAFVSPARRRQFYLLVVLMLLGTLAELATIGSVIPLLSLLSDPSGLGRLSWATGVFDVLGASSRDERLIAATAAFCSFAIAAGILRLRLSWVTQDFMFRLGHEFSVEIQRRILLQPYGFHIQRNTSSLLAAINKTEVLIFELLLPALQAAIATFIAAFIIAALIYIDPFTATVAAVAFSAIYLLVFALARRRLAANSSVSGPAWNERLKILKESLDGIRDVIIDNSQEIYVRRYQGVNSRLNVARASTAFISTAPRIVIEAVGMIVIAIIALVIAQQQGGLARALPVLGAIALGAQRLLPLLQQIYIGWSSAAGNRFVLGEIVDLLRLPVSKEQANRAHVSPLPLRREISVEQVSFTYPSRRVQAVSDVTFEIPAGATVALIGETGSGKSTLADLLMGLLKPDEGRICVDGLPLSGKHRRRWQRSIAHVPQSIFLTDSTIADNIALGLAGKASDRERIVRSAKMARLHDFITSLPDGYETIVGERGIRLSGGQRQRLGIARAIYKQTPVLVLDEATSALDEETEAAVFKSIEELGREGRTIVIIAHRHSTIARCDTVVKLHKGRIVDIGSFTNVVGKRGVRARAQRRP